MSSESRFQLSLRFRGFWDANGDLVEPSLFLARVDGEAERLKKCGAVLIEFPAEVCSRNPLDASADLWKEVAALLRSHALGATVHLPSTWVFALNLLLVAKEFGLEIPEDFRGALSEEQAGPAQD